MYEKVIDCPKLFTFVNRYDYSTSDRVDPASGDAAVTIGSETCNTASSGPRMRVVVSAVSRVETHLQTKTSTMFALLETVNSVNVNGNIEGIYMRVHVLTWAATLEAEPAVQPRSP